MQRILLTALLVAGSLGLMVSFDFTPSNLLALLSMAVALAVFVLAKARWQASGTVDQPVVASVFVAFVAFLFMLFPVGKAVTHAFGTAAMQDGVVTGYHRNRRGTCRSKNDVRLVGGEKIVVCGLHLPVGTPVRVNVASSVFGSYSKQTAEQVDLAGNGALADIMQSADTATRAGDRARRDADEAMRRASSRRAAPRAEADPSQAWADRVLAESARARERAASERVVRDLQASAEQARADAAKASEEFARKTDAMRRSAEKQR